MILLPASEVYALQNLTGSVPPYDWLSLTGGSVTSVGGTYTDAYGATYTLTDIIDGGSVTMGGLTIPVEYGGVPYYVRIIANLWAGVRDVLVTDQSGNLITHKLQNDFCNLDILGRADFGPKGQTPGTGLSYNASPNLYWLYTYTAATNALV